jgi:hypothetical protein
MVLDSQRETSAQRGTLRAPADNYRCEYVIRPFVLGRKGRLFSDTVHGAVASANLRSLLETAEPNVHLGP